jgi:hypothetical protein
MKIIATILFLFLTTGNICGQVVIGPGTADPSAQLDVKSTNRGLLQPRMKQVERDDIVSPPAGLLIWCTDCGNGKIPDGVSLNNNATRNVESAGQMQVFNGKTWTNIYGGEPLPAYPIVSFKEASFPNQSAKLFQPCDFKVTLKYQGGNGVTYNTNGTFYSTNVSGMVAVLENTSGTISRDEGEIVFRVTGLPMTYGDANFEVKFFNNSFSFKVPISSSNLSYGQLVPIEAAALYNRANYYPIGNPPHLYFNPTGEQRAPKSTILHILTPGQNGYDPSFQHGYLLMYNYQGTVGYMGKTYDYYGLKFSYTTYDELKYLFTAKTTNGIYCNVLSSTENGINKYYFLDFRRQNIPAPGIKNVIESTVISQRENNYELYLIHRF